MPLDALHDFDMLWGHGMYNCSRHPTQYCTA